MWSAGLSSLLNNNNNNNNNNNELEMELMDAGKKLLQIPRTDINIRLLLLKLRNSLRKVEQPPSESMKNALRTVIKALDAKELVTHPDLDVNISLSSCFCEILRICAPDSPYDDQQLKAFFEMVVVTLEKCAKFLRYTEMHRVLEIFNRNRLSLLLLGLQSDGAGLKLRLFKQFFMVYGSNPAAIKLEMEKIMTTIIEESVQLNLELVHHLVIFLINTNQIASYDCSKPGEVLMNFAARFKQHIPVTCIVKTECVDTKPTCCQPFFYDPPKSVTEAKGKRKRDNSPLRKQVPSSEGGKVCVHGYEVKQSVADILEAVFKKHGDIAANCIFRTSSMRSPILEVVCEVIKLIQTNEAVERMEEIERQLSDAEAVNISVAWLRVRLEGIRKKTEGLERLNLVRETAKGILLTEKAARKDLKEMDAEVEAAREQARLAEMFVNRLRISENNWDEKILQCKARLDSLAQQAFP